MGSSSSESRAMAGLGERVRRCPISSSSTTRREGSCGFSFFSVILLPPRSTLFPYTTLFRSIALLISILLPSLSKARESAKRVQCQSNLRQLGYAMIQYCNANRGVLPFTSWNDGTLLYSRSEEHTSELQSRQYLVCRLLLEKK